MSNVEQSAIVLEDVLMPSNLKAAAKQVMSNKGAPGVDNMEVGVLPAYMASDFWFDILDQVRDGTYQPKPIRRVYIPKENGDKRPLGIPTVIDRLIQQALAQRLSEYYDEKFSNSSFGYRPGRGAHDAVNQALAYMNQGREWIIDLDLAKFFDTVNHSKLLQVLSKDITDGRVISLIHKFLRAPVFEDGKVGPKTTMGTPQGGCVSPVLANILLNELDQVLDAREIPFVRYADDMMIFCGSKKAAQRILKNVKDFIEKKLFLKVNTEKTKIVSPWQAKFLGFSFLHNRYVAKVRRERHPYHTWFATVHETKEAKFKSSLKEVLDRRAKGGIEAVKRKLRLKVRGWCNYFGTAIKTGFIAEMDEWMRRRIRQLLWKQWKKPLKRRNEFKKRWKSAPELGEYAYSSARYWRMSRTYQIHRALGIRQLKEEGWITLSQALENCAEHPVH